MCNVHALLDHGNVVLKCLICPGPQVCGPQMSANQFGRRSAPHLSTLYQKISTTSPTNSQEKPENVLSDPSLTNTIVSVEYWINLSGAGQSRKKNMEAVAEHDFNASEPDELSFKRGQILKVLNKDEDPHWYKAEVNGVEGLVPSNYIRMMEHSWYLGNITRSDSEALLLKLGNPDGAFLVRRSESTPGEFSISVRFDNAVQHFKVLRDIKMGQYYLWSKRFNSLNELINYHRANSISKTHNILLRSMDSAFSNKHGLVQALFDFTPQEEGELGFQRGDIITVTKREDENWWEGTLNNRAGIFPATYVCPYNSG